MSRSSELAQALADAAADLPEPAMTVAEAALLFRVDPKTVRRWVAAGEFTDIRLPGGGMRLSRAEVRDRLRGGRPDREEPPT